VSHDVDVNANADLLEDRTGQVPTMAIVWWLLIEHPLLDVLLDRRPSTRIRRSIFRILTTSRPLNTFIELEDVLTYQNEQVMIYYGGCMKKL